MFTRQCLGRRRIPDLRTLRRESHAWNRRVNRARTQIQWRFDRKTARQTFGYQRQSFKRSKDLDSAGVQETAVKTYVMLTRSLGALSPRALHGL